MSSLRHRPHAVLFAATLALVAGRQGQQEVITASPLLTSLTVVLLVIGGIASLLTALRRPRVVRQRQDGVVIAPHITAASPNAGFGWGVGN